MRRRRLFLVEMTGTKPGVSCEVHPIDISPHFVLSLTLNHVTSAMKGQMCSFFAVDSCDVHHGCLKVEHFVKLMICFICLICFGLLLPSPEVVGSAKDPNTRRYCHLEDENSSFFAELR